MMAVLIVLMMFACLLALCLWGAVADIEALFDFGIRVLDWSCLN